jgi:hypothetical protein
MAIGIIQIDLTKHFGILLMNRGNNWRIFN